MANQLTLLPLEKDLWIEVLDFLEPAELASVEAVSREWRGWVHDGEHSLWKRQAQRAGCPAARFDQETRKDPLDSSREAKDFFPEMYLNSPLIGRAQWIRFCGVDPGPSPISYGMYQALQGRCPIFPEQRMRDTHIGVWIPDRVTRTMGDRVEKIDVTLANLPTLIPQAKYAYLGDEIEESYRNIVPRKGWMFMTKTFLPRSEQKKYEQHQNLVRQTEGYELPRVLDVVIAVFMHRIFYEKPLLGRDPWVYTSCERRNWIVGGFSPEVGIDIDDQYLETGTRGVVGVRRIEDSFQAVSREKK